MEKTVREWFDYLPNNVKQKALNSVNSSRLNEKVKSLYSAINTFSWAHTDEGYTYWSKIEEDIERGVFDKIEIPIKGIKKKLSL